MTKIEALKLARQVLFDQHRPLDFVPMCKECDRIKEMDALIVAESAVPEAATPKWERISDIGPMPSPHVIRGPGLLSVYMKHSGEWFRYDLPEHSSPQEGSR